MGEQEHYIITKTAASLRRRVHVPSFYYTRRGLFRNGPLPLYRFLYALLYVLYASLICPGSPSDSFVDSASVKTKKKKPRENWRTPQSERGAGGKRSPGGAAIALFPTRRVRRCPRTRPGLRGHAARGGRAGRRGRAGSAERRTRGASASHRASVAL